MQIDIRRYKNSDCADLARLFYDTVHTVNAQDYTQNQLDVWATGKVDLNEWDKMFSSHFTIVATAGGSIAGFGDIDSTAYLNMLYVHKDYQKMGVATAICNALEEAAGNVKITTHASVTAKPFFEKRGYATVKAQQVERGGVFLKNFIMQKPPHA